MRIDSGNNFRQLTCNTRGYKLPLMKTTLAERLAQAMNARDMSQGALARASGIAQPTIWRLVKGQAKGSTKLVAIAKALRVNADWLDSGIGEMESGLEMTYPDPTEHQMKLGSVFPVNIWNQDGKTDDEVYVPVVVKSDTCRAYVLSRNSGCAEAPAGTIVVIDTGEKPGNGDLVYAKVNSSFSVYRFLEGGDSGFLTVDDSRIPIIDIETSAELIGVAVFLLRDLKRKK